MRVAMRNKARDKKKQEIKHENNNRYSSGDR